MNSFLMQVFANLIGSSITLGGVLWLAYRADKRQDKEREIERTPPRRSFGRVQ